MNEFFAYFKFVKISNLIRFDLTVTCYYFETRFIGYSRLNRGKERSKRKGSTRKIYSLYKLL